MSKHITLFAATVLLATIACTFTIPSPGSLTGVTGSGNIVTVTPELAGFDQVDISHAFKATIEQGNTYQVVIRIDDNLAQYLDARVSGGTLIIGLDRSIGFDFGASTLEVDITMPALSGVELSGASRALLSGFDSTDDLNLEISGAGNLGGEVHSGDLAINLSGASTVDLRGSGGNLVLKASGASTAELSDFAVEDARVELSGASRGIVNAGGTLDVEASGASHLSYVGSPTLGSINTSGASTINPE